MRWRHSLQREGSSQASLGSGVCLHRHSAGLAGSGKSLDEGDGDGRQLIGRGGLLPRAARRAALDAVSSYIAAMQPAGWDGDAVAASSILMYHQARQGSWQPTRVHACMLCCTCNSC